MREKIKGNNTVELLSEKPMQYQLNIKDRALSATAEGITISDNLQTDNPIVYANKGFEKLTGYPIEAVLGKLPGDLANILYLLIVPVDTIDKYAQFLGQIDNPKFLSTFLLR